MRRRSSRGIYLNLLTRRDGKLKREKIRYEKAIVKGDLSELAHSQRWQTQKGKDQV